MTKNIYKTITSHSEASPNSIVTSESMNQQQSIVTVKTATDSKLLKQKQSPSEDDLEIKQGCFRKAIPIMPKPLAIITCILNILLPGTGTLVAAFSVMCCGTKHGYSKNIFAFLINFCAFLLQMCSSIIIFGWIWSIKYGLLFIRLANTSPDSPNIEPDLPLYCRRHSSVDHSANLLLYQPTASRINTSLVKVQEEDAVS